MPVRTFDDLDEEEQDMVLDSIDDFLRHVRKRRRENEAMLERIRTEREAGDLAARLPGLSANQLKMSKLVIENFGDKPMMTREIAQKIGNVTSQKITPTLKAMEAAGILVATVKDEKPRRHLWTVAAGETR